MLKYSDKELKFDYKGNVVKLRYPLMSEKRSYEQGCYDIGTGKVDKNFYDFHKEYLLGQGMPEDIYDQMPWDSLEEVTQYLNGIKKNLDSTK